MKTVTLLLFAVSLIGAGCATLSASNPSAAPSSASGVSWRAESCARNGGIWREELTICEFRGGGS